MLSEIIHYGWLVIVGAGLGYVLYAVRNNPTKMLNWIWLGVGLAVFVASAIMYAESFS